MYVSFILFTLKSFWLCRSNCNNIYIYIYWELKLFKTKNECFWSCNRACTNFIIVGWVISITYFRIFTWVTTWRHRSSCHHQINVFTIFLNVVNMYHMYLFLPIKVVQRMVCMSECEMTGCGLPLGLLDKLQICLLNGITVVI